MNNISFQTIWIILCFLSTSCSNTEINDFKWLIGKYERSYNQTIQIEIWQQKQDTLFGKAIFVTNNDSVVMETMYIQKNEKGVWEYIANVPSNDFPVPFELTSINKNRMVFENKYHDFPQTIVYEQRNDSLFAAIIGKQNNFEKSTVFDFKKIK